MEDFALTPAERALFEALNRRDVPFIIIGMGAAILERAPIATQDLDVWFQRADDDRIKVALQPPAFGGDGLQRVDVVLTAHGLDPFATEYARSLPVRSKGLHCACCRSIA